MRFAGHCQSIWQVSLKIFGAGCNAPPGFCAQSSCATDSTLPSPAITLSIVSIAAVAPKRIRPSYTYSTSASSGIGKGFCKMMRPVSMSWSKKNVVTPVSRSPWIMAQLMGAAPRYCGNRAACTLNVPKRGIAHTTSGNMRKATTTCKSA